MFQQPSGNAAVEAVKQRGLLEEMKLGSELWVSKAFDLARSALRTVFLMPREAPPPPPAQQQPPAAAAGKPHVARGGPHAREGAAGSAHHPGYFSAEAEADSSVRVRAMLTRTKSAAGGLQRAGLGTSAGGPGEGPSGPPSPAAPMQGLKRTHSFGNVESALGPAHRQQVTRRARHVHCIIIIIIFPVS